MQDTKTSTICPSSFIIPKQTSWMGSSPYSQSVFLPALVRILLWWLLLALIVSSSQALSLPTTSCHGQPSQQHEWKIPENAQVLHEDPLVYTIHDLLSLEECQEYQRHVLELEARGREMTRSNPPEVSVDAGKLWPLPLLCLGAGIPSLVKSLNSQQDLSKIVEAGVLPISIALAITTALALAAKPVVQAISDRQARTSVAMALNQKEDVEFVAPLVNRVQEATQHKWLRWEAPVVTRYDRGAIFARHGDASPKLGSEWKEEGGQRVITCICYLNDCGEGGETYFDRLGIAVKPMPGKALVFFPSNYDSLRADDRTTHESLPPIEKQKWIVQMFGRVGARVPPPLGLPDDYARTATTEGKMLA